MFIFTFLNIDEMIPVHHESGYIPLEKMTFKSFNTKEYMISKEWVNNSLITSSVPHALLLLRFFTTMCTASKLISLSKNSPLTMLLSV